MSLRVVQKLVRIATEEFGDIVVKAEILHAVRLRLKLIDGSTLDVLYPKPTSTRSTGDKRIEFLE